MWAGSFAARNSRTSFRNAFSSAVKLRSIAGLQSSRRRPSRLATQAARSVGLLAYHGGGAVGSRSYGLRPIRPDPEAAGTARGLHGRGGLSAGGGILRGGGGQPAEGQRLGADSRDRDVEGEGAGAEPLEPVPARVRVRRGAFKSRVRAALRNHGALVPRPGDVQLQRPGYGKHGGAGPVRLPRAQEALARSAPPRRDPLGLRDDGTRRRFLGRDEYPGPDRAARRRVRRQ